MRIRDSKGIILVLPFIYFVPPVLNVPFFCAASCATYRRERGYGPSAPKLVEYRIIFL